MGMLKMIDKTGPEKLEDFVNGLDKSQIAAVTEFINDVGQTFKWRSKKKQEKESMSLTRFYLQFSRNLGKDKGIICAIRNCNDINESASSAEIILEFEYDGNSITTHGSGDFGGCNMQEFGELVSIINPILKERLKLFQ